MLELEPCSLFVCVCWSAREASCGSRTDVSAVMRSRGSEVKKGVVITQIFGPPTHMLNSHHHVCDIAFRCRPFPSASASQHGVSPSHASEIGSIADQVSEQWRALKRSYSQVHLHLSRTCISSMPSTCKSCSAGGEPHKLGLCDEVELL